MHFIEYMLYFNKDFLIIKKNSSPYTLTTLAYGRYDNCSCLSLIIIALDRENFYTYKITVHCIILSTLNGDAFTKMKHHRQDTWNGVHVQDLNSTIGVVCILKINGGAPELFFCCCAKPGVSKLQVQPTLSTFVLPWNHKWFLYCKGLYEKRKTVYNRYVSVPQSQRTCRGQRG